MKITAFILLAFCLHVSASTLAQNVTLSEHKATLGKVITDIKNQTGYSFFYNEEWLENAKLVDLEIKNQPIEEALKECFKNQPLNYAIVNKTIVLKLKDKNDEEILIPTKPVTISGRITDSAGTPLIGATIEIKSSKKAVITDEKGEFTIAANTQDYLVISYIGYDNAEIEITEKTPSFVNIILKQRTNGLKEVVVSTGYQDIPLQQITGSVATVDNQLFNRKTSPDVLSRLEGIVPGLLVNKNVDLTNNPNGIDIAIRGTSTLFSNMQPLIVVDNFPYDGNIQNLNPNDVENVSVLKDAAAAAIWGARSGNGVIVITTKKGHRNMPMSVELNANVTIGKKPNLFYNPNFLDSKDFISLEKAGFNAGLDDATLTDQNHYPVSPVVQLLSDARDGIITQANADQQINALQNYDVRNDLTKYFLQKSVDQQYSLSFRGGNERSDYFYSVGYDNHLDNNIGNKNDRITINATNNFYITKGLTLNTQLIYTKENGQSDGQLGNITNGNGENGSFDNLYPYAQLAGKSGNALPIPRDYNYAWVTDPVAQAGLLDWQYRPLDELHFADNTSSLTDFHLNTGIRYSPFKGFNAEVKYQYENSFSNQQLYYSPETYFARNTINQFTDFTQSNPQGNTFPVPIGGIFNEGGSSLISNRFRSQLSYDNTLATKHEISAILGAEIDDNRTNVSGNATAYGYDKDTRTFAPVDFLDNYLIRPYGYTSTIPSGQSYYFTDNRFISYFGNLAYTYNNRYTVTVTSREDKSNLFGVNTNQKSVPLSTAGLAWTASSEDFYHITWLPYLKFRVSHGSSGNINFGSTAVTTFAQFGSGLYYSIPWGIIQSPGNPDLRWEKDIVTNLGVNFGLRNNILNGSFDYYLRNSDNLYSSTILPPSSGYSSFFANVASSKGHGFDLTLNFVPLSSTRIKWASNLIVSHSVDVVSQYHPNNPYYIFYLFQGASASTIYPVAGRPVFSIYSLKSAGLTHDTGDPQGYLNGKLSTDYAQLLNHASVPDSMKFWGSARPTYYGSFRNTVSYKSVSISANIIYKFGYYFRKPMLNYSALINNWLGNSQYSERWQKPGDETKTFVPSLPSDLTNLDSNRDLFYSYSESSIDKGDHIRLQDITINYLLRPQGWSHNTIKSLNIFCIGNNIGILWRANHDHLDPDVFQSQSFQSGYPTPRTISFGVKASL